MLYGEQRVEGRWYNFDRATGAMSTGLTDLGYKTVLYGEDGAMLYGLQEVGGVGERFFDPVTGEIATNCWVNISDSYRGYFNENGVRLFLI